MSDPNRALLRIPQGTERFSLEEAQRHRRLVRRIEDFLLDWGYLPAQTPVVDFFDVYDALLSRGDRRKVYRLIDRDGEVLMLRSDVTIFLAKQMGLLLRSEDLPVRVFYADTILRHQEAYDISRNEFYQAGIELIGLSGIPGEIEVLFLLCELFRHIDVPEFYCHIGSRSLFTAGMATRLTASRGSEDAKATYEEARQALSLRRFGRLDDLVDGGLTPAQKNLFPLILESEEFLSRVPELKAGLSGPEVEELCALAQVVQGLSDLGCADHFRVDFSEVGNQPYHSGLAFQAYIEGVDSAVASGGRYDGLLAQFGFPAASVGFSIMLRKLEPQLTQSGPSDEVAGTQPSGETPTQRLKSASTIVRAGGRVKL